MSGSVGSDGSVRSNRSNRSNRSGGSNRSIGSVGSNRSIGSVGPVGVEQVDQVKQVEQVGTKRARYLRVTAKSYRELVCWQLSEKLRDEVIAVLARSALRVDRRFCEDCASAARSAASNISEGFGRSDGIFARHLDIALGSLHEMENHIDEALQRRFLTADEHQELRRQAKRASMATWRLLQYLKQASQP